MDKIGATLQAAYLCNIPSYPGQDERGCVSTSALSKHLKLTD